MPSCRNSHVHNNPFFSAAMLRTLIIKLDLYSYRMAAQDIWQPRHLSDFQRALIRVISFYISHLRFALVYF